MKKQLAKVGHATVCASLALFILLGVTAHAQTLVNKSWVKTTGLPDAIHWTGSSFDFEKNLIFVGNTVSAPGNANILVTKYRSDGAVAWQRTSGGSAGLNDYGVAVAVDNQNNSYIAAAMTAANGLFDFAVLKYDVNGQLQWTATWDGANHLHDIPTAISLDDVGNVIVVGSSVSFAQQSNYAIVKYNSAGIQLWATTYDHAGFHDFPTAIAKASNDNIVVTGASASAPNSWDYATLLVNGLTGQIENVNRVNVPEVGLDQPLAVARDHQNNLYITGYNEKLGNKNIQTVKLNAHFGLEWVRSFDADGMEDVAKAIGCDANGNVYLAGYSKTGQEGETFRILKYNPQGDEVWNKTYKPYTHDGARAIDIKVLPTGDIYVSGTIEKGSEKDFATIKYNSDGEMEWEKRFEGAGADEVTTLKADNNGNVYVSGISTLANNSKEYTTVKYRSEKKPLNFIRNAKGQPSYIADELIVKFAPAALKLSFINETEWTYGTVEDVLTDLAIHELENVLPFPIRDNPQVRFTKIFDWMKSTDTITISRLGRRTATPTFWTTLLFTIPEGYDINSITTLLNGVFPTVEYSELDYLNRPLSVPNDSFVSYQSSLLPDAIDRNAHINIDSAWNFMTGKNYVNVGVYDFPIYWKHPDFGGTNFRNSVVKGGRDYWTLRDISLVDVPSGDHGTSVAGIIGMSLHNTRRGYANNLAPEDVEFILQKYSTDIAGTIVVGDSSSGMDVPVDCSTRPDILNGWGRLNAGAALRMIDTPRYYILHPLENPILPLPANVFLNDTTIFLPEDINGVAAGNYTASRYQVSETYRITAPINTRIIDAWRRLSASKGYADIATTTTRIQNDPAATFTFTYDTSRTQVDVRATAFYYRVRVGTNLVWIPDNPALLKKFAYSIHLENKLYTKQEEIVNPITHFAAFPNPTSGMLSIDYQLNQFSPHIQLDVFDVAGRLVQTISLSPSQGDKTTVDIQDLAAGVYFIRLTANEYQAYQKIIKL